MAQIREPWRKIQQKHRRLLGFKRKVASQQMMILSAARSMSPDVAGRYPSMVNQTNHKMQTKPQHHHGSNQITMAIDTLKIPTAVGFQKKSFITADDDPLCCEIYVL
jgi:hypothetical protein